MQSEPPKTYWAVCRTFSNRVHRVAPEIEKANHGTFLPTYARVWSSNGKLSARERVLFPGYLFFQTDATGWGAVSEIDGVDEVLAHGERASRVTDDEMCRMMISHATREHDERDTTGLERTARRKRYRRPRASKRARAGV
jgi:N-methylhydantoinase B/oxoprolinase/acetone carboxylase alpha subunit